MRRRADRLALRTVPSAAASVTVLSHYAIAQRLNFVQRFQLQQFWWVYSSGDYAAWPYDLAFNLSFQDFGYYVVVVGFCDLAAVEGAGDQGVVRAEVVDEDFAVDLWGVHEGAALPEEVVFFADAFN